MGAATLLTTTLALSTLYEYYTSDGITSGLTANSTSFLLNEKNITIYSGAFHYFRVPKQYWRDRLRKMRAAGLNAVETYIPWNLHEPLQGTFDFGDGGTDMQDFLDVEEFLKTAQEEDLFALVRSGPYICAEWEFGGLPSWILRNSSVVVRTSDETYIYYVTRYFNELMSRLAKLQFTKGGSIIAFQVENEYGNTKTDKFDPDKKYLQQLRQLMLDNGIVELLYTSDSASRGTIGSLPDVLLQTVNFARNPENEFDTLNSFQKNRPTMAMEYWTGWYDKWTEGHQTRDNTEFQDVLERILKYPASLNMYMFMGGTSFGFTSGANLGSIDNSQYMPLTNSYDYDAPLAENGDYTEKYNIVKDVIAKYNKIPTKLPDQPALVPRVAYDSLAVNDQLTLSEVIDKIDFKITSENLLPMELLSMNENNGQSFGYIIYSKTMDISANSVLKISGYVCDTVLVLVNDLLINKPFSNKDDMDGFGFWRLKDSNITLSTIDLKNATLNIVVENMGRNNFGSLEQFKQYKGLWKDNTIYLNDQTLTDWVIKPLEFKTAWTSSLTGWHPPINELVRPSLYKVELEITDDPKDTYIDMTEWTKGIVIVNGFVLGRHFKVGPQQALYLPAPFLKKGTNEIIVFGHFQPATTVKFSTDMIYGI